MYEQQSRACAGRRCPEDNLDLVGVFAEGGIVEDELRASLFDGAGIRVSFVHWQDPDSHGEIRLRRGTLARRALRCGPGREGGVSRACRKASRRRQACRRTSTGPGIQARQRRH
jgi:hypothetical protein